MADFVEVMKIRDRMCESIERCHECPINTFKNGKDISCESFSKKYPEQVQEILLKWDKEHPIKTNADKFEEVFGFRPSIVCPMYRVKDCEDGDCWDCLYREFWDREYKEPEAGNDI